jgi:hypothetical protein
MRKPIRDPGPGEVQRIDHTLLQLEILLHGQLCADADMGGIDARLEFALATAL